MNNDLYPLRKTKLKINFKIFFKQKNSLLEENQNFQSKISLIQEQSPYSNSN
jgi:hypothetical protein